MRLTERCIEMLKLLQVSRWLTTGQFKRRFFGRATVDAAHKRLRQLVKHGYLVKVQPHRMQEAVFTLGPEGKRMIERAGASSIVLERRLPKQLEHFLGINDVRIAAEMSLQMRYFFACWELAGVDWKQPIIPDAVFAVDHRTFAVEYDRGQESLRFFLRTKLSSYWRGLDEFHIYRLLIVTDRPARMESLAKAIGQKGAAVLLTRLDLVRQHGFAAPIFHKPSLDRAVTLL
jgi:hypothetical protein